MERGYIWSIYYTRCNNNGKCENLRMEIQFAVYSKTKNILMYFSEVDKSIINKVIVSGFELCCLSVESC